MKRSSTLLTKHTLVFPVFCKAKTLCSLARKNFIDVHCKLGNRHAKRSGNEVIEMIFDLIAVSTKSIYCIEIEFQHFEDFSPPGKNRPSKKGSKSRMEKYDDFTLNAFRRKVMISFPGMRYQLHKAF